MEAGGTVPLQLGLQVCRLKDLSCHTVPVEACRQVEGWKVVLSGDGCRHS